MNDLESIKKSIISRSFSLLEGEDIEIDYFNLESSLIDWGRFTPSGIYIEVNPLLKDSSESVVRGGLASVLSEIASELAMNYFTREGDAFFYNQWEHYKVLSERNNALNVVLRGHGQDYLEFLKFATQNGYPGYQKEGLSIKEMNVLLSLGKK